MVRTIIVIFLALSFAGGSAYAQEAKLKEFIATDFHRSLIHRALDGVPPTIFQRCPGLISSSSQVTVIKPVSFAQDGFPNAGMWKEAFPVSGCSNDIILNFYFIATSDEKVNFFMGFPGSSVADPILQKDAMMQAVMAAAKPENKDCKDLYVTNTEFLQKAEESLEGSKGPPWDERWTLSMCTTKAQVIMHFIPDKTGTTIHASMQETKFLK